MFAVTIKITGFKRHSIPTSTRTKHRTTSSLFVVTRYNLLPLANLHLIINQKILLRTTLSLVLFSLKPMIFFSVKLDLCLLQIVAMGIFHISTQLDDARINQRWATHYDCSKQNNPSHFSLFLVQKCTAVPPGNDFTRIFALFSFVLRQKKTKTFAVLQLL